MGSVRKTHEHCQTPRPRYDGRMTFDRLFSTRIETHQLDAAPSLDELETACWMIEEGDTAGHDWCEQQGYPGYTSYASLDDLPDRAPAIAPRRSSLAATSVSNLASGFDRGSESNIPN